MGIHTLSAQSAEDETQFVLSVSIRAWMPLNSLVLGIWLGLIPHVQTMDCVYRNLISIEGHEGDGWRIERWTKMLWHFPLIFTFCEFFYLLPSACLALVPSISFPSKCTVEEDQSMEFLLPQRDWHFCRHKWDWFSGTKNSQNTKNSFNDHARQHRGRNQTFCFQFCHLPALTFWGVILMLLCLSFLL